MKKLLFLTLLMLSVVGARAQQPSFIEFFGDYAVRGDSRASNWGAG